MLPDFVRQAFADRLAESSTARNAVRVMSHNDVNPTNLVFDGERILLLDWQTAAPNDPYYDLAALAMFFRLDDAACQSLVAAHDGRPIEAVPEAFKSARRLAAVLSGAAALHSARVRGHTGGLAAVEAVPSLGELYAQLRTGALDLRTVNGQWQFGLALVMEGARLP
jgi:aminoglycoside phosphotransferase (APT) family kinase protein